MHYILLALLGKPFFKFIEHAKVREENFNLELDILVTEDAIKEVQQAIDLLETQVESDERTKALETRRDQLDMLNEALANHHQRGENLQYKHGLIDRV